MEKHVKNGHHFPLLAVLSSTVDCALLRKWHRCLQASFGQYYVAHFNLVEPSWWHLYPSLAVPFHDADREDYRTFLTLMGQSETLGLCLNMWMWVFKGSSHLGQWSNYQDQGMRRSAKRKHNFPSNVLGNLNKREGYSFLGITVVLFFFGGELLCFFCFRFNCFGSVFAAFGFAFAFWCFAFASAALAAFAFVCCFCCFRFCCFRSLSFFASFFCAFVFLFARASILW